MKWKDKLINDLKTTIKNLDDEHYHRYIKKIDDEKVSLHLAIFSEPFLNFLINGIKTIESRLSINNVAPFRKVAIGDIVFVKKSAGGVCAIFEVENVQYYSNLNAKILEAVNKKLGEKLCWHHDPEFLELKLHSKFLTLVFIENLFELPEFPISKSDRTGWVLVRRGLRNTLFDNEND